jgi:hypothetical protein
MTHDPTLRPGDHYRCLGDSEWHTVPELRTADNTVDLVRAIGLELRRRDPGFLLGTVEADPEKGTGTYEAAVGDGKTATKKFRFHLENDTVVIDSPELPKPTSGGGPNKDKTIRTSEENTMINPYAADIAKLRVASGTFEKHAALAEQYQAIEAAAAKITAENEAAFRALAAASSDLEQYRAPNPYTAGLKALQEKRK